MKGSSTEVLALFLRLSMILLTILKNVALSEKRRNMEYLGLGHKRHMCTLVGQPTLFKFLFPRTPGLRHIPSQLLFHFTPALFKEEGSMGELGRGEGGRMGDGGGREEGR